MDAWTPGTRVLTERDHAAWTTWRKDRKRDQQRERRAKLRRIDYYASADATAVLEGLWSAHPGHNFSAILDRIVADWAAQLPPE